MFKIFSGLPGMLSYGRQTNSTANAQIFLTMFLVTRFGEYYNKIIYFQEMCIIYIVVPLFPPPVVLYA